MSFRVFRSVARAAALAAGGLVCVDAHALGRVVLFNELPVEARCGFNVAFIRDDPLAWSVELTQELVVLQPGGSVRMDLPLQAMPAQVRLSPSGAPHLYSGAFEHVELVCHTTREAAAGPWRHVYSARFDNGSGSGSDSSSDSVGVAQDWLGCYTLSRETPTDLTEWRMRLRPALDQVTLEEMRFGAPIDLHVSSRMVASDGSLLAGAPTPVGVYRIPLEASDLSDASGDSSSSSSLDSNQDGSIVNGHAQMNGNGAHPGAAT